MLYTITFRLVNGPGPSVRERTLTRRPDPSELKQKEKWCCFRLSLNEEESEGLVEKKHQGLLHPPEAEAEAATDNGGFSRRALQLQPNSALEFGGRKLLVQRLWTLQFLSHLQSPDVLVHIQDSLFLLFSPFWVFNFLMGTVFCFA